MASHSTIRGSAIAAIVVAAAVLLSPHSATAQFRQSAPKLVGTGAAGEVPPAQGLSAAISASGQTVIVGGPLDGQIDDVRYGAAWIFQRDAGAWSQQGSKLVGTYIETGPGGSATRQFQGQGNGVALSADGNTAVVGAQTHNTVIVWTRSAGVWAQQAALATPHSGPGSPSSDALLGRSVAVSADGNTVVAGGPRDFGGNATWGAIWVWSRSGATWSQGGKFQRFDANPLTGHTPFDAQGASVAISGDGNTIITGSTADLQGPSLKGAAFVWVRSGNTWVAQGSKLVGSGTATQQGRSVALSYDGNTAIVSSTQPGTVWIWTRSGGAWTEQARLANVGGRSVALSRDGNTAIVGNSGSGSGGVLVFTRSGGAWTQQGGLLAGNDSVGNSQQGSAVGLSTDAGTLVVGGFNDNGGIGAAWVYDQSPTATAVTPNIGSVNGGTNVTIKGSGFISGSTVTFGHVAATGITVVDPTTITAVTPARPPGAVDVEVVTVMGRATAAAAYTYRSDSTVSLGSAQNPSTFNGAVDYTATVTAGATGMVDFKEASTTLASIAISGNTAVANLTLPTGAHSLTAVYNGDNNYLGSRSAPLSQTVSKAATSTSLAAAPAAAKAGQSISFTATIASGAGPPDDLITFTDGATVLGSMPLSAGQAALNAALNIGSHNVSATFAGNDNYFGSGGSRLVTVSANAGAETAVNSHTAKSQQQPAVARLKAGYLVAWASNGQDGSGFGIYAQRYTAAGARAGQEFGVNKTTSGAQTQPAAAGLPDGSFVVVWQSVGQDGSGSGIYGQRFSAAGAKHGNEFRVNATIAGDQVMPAVAALPNGDFVVVWSGPAGSGLGAADRSGQGIYAQRYKATGVASGAEFTVNKTTQGDQTNPVIARLGDGFVVAWQGPDASGLGIFAQRFDAASKPVGPELKLNTLVANDQSLPAIAALSDGGFVIAYQSALQDGSGLGIFMRRFSASGVASGAENRVNTTVAGDQATPAVAAFSDGGFAVAWVSADGRGQGIFAQAFDDAGDPVDAEFRVNTTTAGNQTQPAAAAFAGGTFVVAWTSAGQDGSAEGIYSQRLHIPQPP